MKFMKISTSQKEFFSPVTLHFLSKVVTILGLKGIDAEAIMFESMDLVSKLNIWTGFLGDYVVVPVVIDGSLKPKNILAC